MPPFSWVSMSGTHVMDGGPAAASDGGVPGCQPAMPAHEQPTDTRSRMTGTAARRASADRELEVVGVEVGLATGQAQRPRRAPQRVGGHGHFLGAGTGRPQLAPVLVAMRP